MLTKALAVEWAPYNIDVNAITLGYTITPMVSEVFRKPWIRKDQLKKGFQLID